MMSFMDGLEKYTDKYAHNESLFRFEFQVLYSFPKFYIHYQVWIS